MPKKTSAKKLNVIILLSVWHRKTDIHEKKNEFKSCYDITIQILCTD